MNQEFVHLNLHSEYSMTSGIIRIDEMFAKLAADGQKAVALTDSGNMFAAIKFYKAALKNNIKPILGVVLEVYKNNKTKTFNLILLAQNSIGFKNLKNLVSKSYLEGQHHGKPICNATWLKELADGIIVLSGATRGDIGQALLAGDIEQAENNARYWNQIYPGRFYLELVRTNRPGEEQVVENSLYLAEKLKLPVVASNDVHFLKEQDFAAHEARVCINEGRLLSDPRRQSKYAAGQYLCSQQEMQEKFSDIKEALSNSVEIAKRCTVILELGKSYLPLYPIPGGQTEAEYLTELANQGLTEKLTELFPDKNKREVKAAEYKLRLQEELEVILKMGFPGYFLIVSDFIKWAKKQAIPVGPGRGSGAGSLVAFSLDITELDPIAYDLLFERFLNPDRISMPDFDIDFCIEGRDRVISYVAEKYGVDKVSQIITFGSMNAKAVVRDAGRVLGYPYGMVDSIAKLIPFDLKMTLDKALSESEDLANRYADEDEAREIIDLAKSLEGIKRNAGKHAGGVVISATELTDFTPIYCEENASSLVTQFDKSDVEDVGLVKFDFLGLRNLTIINWTLQTINAAGTEKINIRNIPLDDPEVYKLLCAQKTTAVFQLESRGVKELIKRLQPEEFEEIIALVALYRPGPLDAGMTDDFVERKHGRQEVKYSHPLLQDILAPTYGVMVYQEQVMHIAQALAGYTLGEADILRRAMGKKDLKEMAEQRSRFVSGANANDVPEKVSSKIFDAIEQFAKYAFNKSHSAAYALIAYQTAWLKTHYPAAFMAAVMSADMHHTDKVVFLLEESRKLGLKVQPPDINLSDFKFIASDADGIIYGLGAIKGVGESAINLILQERKNGMFTDLYDFCQRLDSSRVNKRVIEALIKSGAMDSIVPLEAEPNPWQGRATLFVSLPIAMRAAEQVNRNKDLGQNDLFSSEDIEQNQHFEYVDTRPWGEKERLYSERNTLGLFLTGHPIAQYKPELKNFVSCEIGDIDSNLSIVRFAGLLLEVRVRRTKKGKSMANIRLDDRSGQIEVTLFSRTYEEFRHLLEPDAILIIEGAVRNDDYTGGFSVTVDKVMDLDTARAEYVKYMQISYGKADSNMADELHAVLKPFVNNGCPVKINYVNQSGKGDIWLGSDWRVKPAEELIERLNSLSWVDDASLYYN